jgi:apolipoprotein N-acyltransferase
MKSNRQSFAWLATGIILMLFSNGRWIIPFATWLYPVFFLRFMRMQKPARGFILLAPACAFVNAISCWKMIPVPLPIYFALTCLFFNVFALTFLIDRVVAVKLKGIASTLVFPVAWCSVEYLTSFSPKATWFSLAYTQSSNLSLMQLVSVTGIWGISFMITWFASVMNWIWAEKFEWIKIRRSFIVFGTVAGAVILFGVIRLHFFNQKIKMVRTASIVAARNINADLSSCKWNDAKAVAVYSNEVENNLLTKTQEAARAGAKIVLWQESAGFIPKKEEKDFIDHAKLLAAMEKIYLLMTLWSIPEDFPQHLIENKMVIINPDGAEQLTYMKNNPAPPEPIIKGNGLIPALETIYGKIAPAICYDAEFQNFIRQAGKNKVDIMFLPANDWKEIDPIHSYMAVTRAIENGFSLVHPAGQGLSVAIDNRGRIISSMDFYTTNEQIMYADVPSGHSNTIYTQIGDGFAWLCIASLITILVSIFFKENMSRLSVMNKKMKPGFEH